jgi:hypothetical protein
MVLLSCWEVSDFGFLIISEMISIIISLYSPTEMVNNGLSLFVITAFMYLIIPQKNDPGIGFETYQESG